MLFETCSLSNYVLPRHCQAQKLWFYMAFDFDFVFVVMKFVIHLDERTFFQRKYKRCILTMSVNEADEIAQADISNISFGYD